jgi:hypothetical protein
MVDPEIDKTLAALQGGLKSADEESGRDASSTALRAVIEFVNAIPTLASQNLALPLVHLLSALQDLDSGRVAPMLAPAKGFDNRKPDAGMRKVQRAFAIFAVDELRRFGMSTEAACLFVVDVLKEAGVAIGGRRGAPEWKTIRAWRDDTTRRRPEDQQASVLAALRDEGRLADDMPLAEVQRALTSLLVPRLRALQKGLE